MKWIKRKLGITDIVKKQDEANKILIEIAEQTRRNADLQERYNKAYHVK